MSLTTQNTRAKILSVHVLKILITIAYSIRISTIISKR
jgi:hypothetical protein